MGCGCKERKEKMVKYLKNKGYEKTATVVSKIPSPGKSEESEEKDLARRG